MLTEGGVAAGGAAAAGLVRAGLPPPETAHSPTVVLVLRGACGGGGRVFVPAAWRLSAWRRSAWGDAGW